MPRALERLFSIALATRRVPWIFSHRRGERRCLDGASGRPGWLLLPGLVRAERGEALRFESTVQLETADRCLCPSDEHQLSRGLLSCLKYLGVVVNDDYPGLRSWLLLERRRKRERSVPVSVLS